MKYTKETLDQLRINCEFGDGTRNPIVMTPAVAEIVDDNMQSLMFEFMNFDNWDKGWDADDLHEIGVIDFDGTHIMFKITPHDTEAGTFVLTFMLPKEW